MLALAFFCGSEAAAAFRRGGSRAQSLFNEMVAAPEVELSITVPLPSDHLQATDSHEMEDNGMPEVVVVAA